MLYKPYAVGTSTQNTSVQQVGGTAIVHEEWTSISKTAHKEQKMYWVHVEADSTFARAEKEELVWVMNDGDPKQGALQNVLCIELYRLMNDTVFSSVHKHVCGNAKASTGLQRHTTNNINLYSWPLPSINSSFHFSMSLMGGVAGNAAFTQAKYRDLVVDNGCWVLRDGTSLPNACRGVPGIGTEYYQRLFEHVGKVVGSERPDAMVLAFSGTHYYQKLRSLAEDFATEELERTLPDQVKEQHYAQPHFTWMIKAKEKERAHKQRGNKTDSSMSTRPKLMPKPWDCQKYSPNYTHLCEPLMLRAAHALQDDVKSRATRHVEFVIRSAKASFEGPILWRAPYEPQSDANRTWGHAETQLAVLFQRRFCEAAAAVLDGMEDVKLLHAERVVAGKTNATSDNLHFDGGFQRTIHASPQLREQTVTHNLFRLFLKGLIDVQNKDGVKVSILKRVMHRTNRLYANWSVLIGP